MIRYGILGSGQLALYLKKACRDLGAEPWCLARSERDPAALKEDNIVYGVDQSAPDMKKLFSKVDVVTFENEFVDLNALCEAAKAYPEVFIYPSVEAIRVCQNKLNQKKLFKDLGLPTADYVEFDFGGDFSEEEFRAFLDRVSKKFSQGFVLKWARGGYDGKGNQMVFKSDIPLLTDASYFNLLCDFARQAFRSGAELYAEKKVEFLSELALVGSFAEGSEPFFYPLVITQQEKGVCKLVLGPFGGIQKMEADKKTDIERRANQFSETLAEELRYQGVLALEFFLQSDGSLLINELAPRVHNSGHHSMDSHSYSQFHLHVAIGLKKKLKPSSLGSEKSAYGMLNILGEANDSKSLDLGVEASLRSKIHSDQMQLYWYNKSKLKKGRKMGHLNFFAPDSDNLFKLLSEVQKLEQDIQKDL